MNDIIMLSLLLEGPKHGYRLKQEAARLSSGETLHNNTVYPRLNRFLADGWITQSETQGDRGQTRLLYELTLAGHHALIARLNSFDQADATSAPAFRLRVGLFDLLEPADRLRILRLRDSYLADRLRQSAAIAQAHQISGWPARSFAFATEQLNRERDWIAELSQLVDLPSPLPSEVRQVSGGQPET